MENTNMMASQGSMAGGVSSQAAGSQFAMAPQQQPTQQVLPFELESGFEPQTRARSNTWPLRRPEGYVNSVVAGVPGVKENIEDGTPPQQTTIGQADRLLPVKKNSSRRNAWGNLSYADLITQAITSAPDQRLTLSQIYEWMVQNVPYFKDKADSNSSAGWKNSIRHNLSLHNRFMRVQNNGTGKSSWWMINLDAKPGKSARRRAASMETSKFEKRRGRVKKMVETLKNGGLQATDVTASSSNSVSEGLDFFPDSPLHPTSGFQLSPNFRPRASSNASSCSRLSPIPAALNESDWTPTYTSSYNPEQLEPILAGSLAETMKLESYQMYQTSTPSQQQQQQHQQQTLRYMMQTQQDQRQIQTASIPPHTLTPCGPTPNTVMSQHMGPPNNTALLDDLNINIETLHGGFDCNVDEVIKHELLMDGTLDFNFQQDVMGTATVAATIQVTEGSNILEQNDIVTQSNAAAAVGSTTNNPAIGVYGSASANAANPAAPHSWVY